MTNLFSLFGEAELNRYAQSVEVTDTDRTIVKKWLNRITNHELEGEQQNYLDFYDEILRNLLGYRSEDREFEHHTQQGRRVEFCIVDREKFLSYCLN